MNYQLSSEMSCACNCFVAREIESRRDFDMREMKKKAMIWSETGTEYVKTGTDISFNLIHHHS